jgi:serine/threonine protein kinase
MASERWLCPSCGATSDPAPEPPPGCSKCDAPLHVGKFGLLAEIEPDRSARVYRGREASGRTEVIVRIFPEHLKLDVAGIRQAAKRAAALSHPVIAAPLDVGTHRNQPYFVETAVPGIPITNANLTLRESVGLMRILALALDHAHGRGVVHPDLRAGDVRISREADRQLGIDVWRVSLTGFGIANGGSVRDNVGAFGRILYAAATGRAPRDWATLAPSSVNPLVDSHLEAIILMAMDSNASQQPPSMEELAAELGRWLDGGAKADPAPKTAPPLKATVRQPWKTWGLLGGSAAAVLLLLMLVFRRGDRPIDPVPVVRVPQAKEARATLVKSPPPPPTPVEPPPAKPEPPPPSVEPPKPTAKLAEDKPQPATSAPLPEVIPTPAKPVEPPPAKPDPAPVKVEPPKPPPEPAKPAPPPPEPEKPAPLRPVKPPQEKPVPPPPPPAPKPAPEPAPPPPEESSSAKATEDKPAAALGDVFRVHPKDGVFVKLNGAISPAAGETLEAVRKGKVVAKLRVTELTPAERRYPKGCAVCRIESGQPGEGDSVRKAGR